MKYSKYIINALVICCVLLSGCDKYLNVQPKGYTLLKTANDYDLWLNDVSLDYGIGTLGSYLDIFSDYTDYPTITVPPSAVGELMFTWAPQFSTDLSISPPLWGQHYANINKYNTVLLGIDKATNATDEQKRSLKAEALLGRAFEYFYLVNEYGNEYDSSTADKDLGVPFVTSNDVSQKTPARSTIQEIYTQIISDLNAAIPDLPVDNSNNRFRGSTAAAYSVLARIYFYAGNYTDARKNAELALEKSSATMLDFNGAPPTTANISIQPDVIYGRMVIGYNTAALDFMRSFATNDLRVSELYYSTDAYTYAIRGATLYYPAGRTPSLQYVNTGTSVQEMKLIIAEAAARSNDLSTALQQLDDIRRDRFSASSYEPYQSDNKDSVLENVLVERKHELAFSGLRWFDMRRLDKEGRMDTVYRYDAQENVIATLPPHSTKYTLQIPVQVLQFNPGMQQNP
ncbi:hypothetical protein A9P82_10410 [Arachidicoccus ginsenosidimutans]|uniref:RagB/SusD family nutrient uptake outer membrane protein n=1 Tax=Arachidicoccus sp. BS20 TaxID=1850526 RepID=UPI0007F12D1E|nr:RagB/SusD family nutrient uptake outer membrane protein [Arachidicoccus sp. BS20]ANI89663.1 hypothetical protein A9P82_10410 [Arachidicoccus sp. BS20]